MQQATAHHTTALVPVPGPEVTFTYNFEGHPLRVIDRGGIALFVARDLCRALGLDNVTAALKPLAPDEKTTLVLSDDEAFSLNSNKGENRGGRERAVVTEGGMYTVVLRSRRATEPDSVAYRFRRWVTGEVLPAIHRTGAYALPARIPPRVPVPQVDPLAMLQDVDVLLPLLATMAQRAKVAEAKVIAAQPAVDFCDALADSDGTWGLQAAAKALHQGPGKFVACLEANGDLFRLNGGLVAKQRLIDRGLFTVVWAEHGGKPRPTTRLTGKGIVHYARELGVRPPHISMQGILPGF